MTHQEFEEMRDEILALVADPPHSYEEYLREIFTIADKHSYVLSSDSLLELAEDPAGFLTYVCDEEEAKRKIMSDTYRDDDDEDVSYPYDDIDYYGYGCYGGYGGWQWSSSQYSGSSATKTQKPEWKPGYLLPVGTSLLP